MLLKHDHLCVVVLFVGLFVIHHVLRQRRAIHLLQRGPLQELSEDLGQVFHFIHFQTDRLHAQFVFWVSHLLSIAVQCAV